MAIQVPRVFIWTWIQSLATIQDQFEISANQSYSETLQITQFSVQFLCPQASLSPLEEQRVMEGYRQTSNPLNHMYFMSGFPD